MRGRLLLGAITAVMLIAVALSGGGHAQLPTCHRAAEQIVCLHAEMRQLSLQVSAGRLQVDVRGS